MMGKMTVEETLLPPHIFLVQKHLKQENGSSYIFSNVNLCFLKHLIEFIDEFEDPYVMDAVRQRMLMSSGICTHSNVS